MSAPLSPGVLPATSAGSPAKQCQMPCLLLGHTPQLVACTDCLEGLQSWWRPRDFVVMTVCTEACSQKAMGSVERCLWARRQRVLREVGVLWVSLRPPVSATSSCAAILVCPPVRLSCSVEADHLTMLCIHR